MSSVCQRQPSSIRLAIDLRSVSQASYRPKVLQTSCCSIAATFKTYCTLCTPIWAHVSGLPPSTSDDFDFAANSSIQCRGLSTSRVAIPIRLYLVRPLRLTVLLRAHPLLARDILLYTLLADLTSEGSDEHLRTIWNFYYHFSIDKGTLVMVLNQCRVLVDLSSDIDTWNNSKYGAFLRFSSLHSLSTIGKHWTLYIETKNFSKGEMDALRAEFRKGGCAKDSIGAKIGLGFCGVRSSGPLCSESKDIMPKQFDHYWKTGVTFDEPDKVAKANEVNPTFIYSAMTKTLPLSYGSNPILPFHLAGILAPISGSQSDNDVSASGLVQGAVEEFKS